ncbi:MAG: ribokinase [Candidatus Hydrogenedentes bacterium]|nr:ribokinase [Candidatus Hydrogenedentota bacterium]
MSSRRILVVGSANIDLVTRVPRIPKPGESLIGHSFTTFTGGKGANQAVAAARLGAATSFAGCVGADVFGEMQRASLSAEGIDLRFLKTHAAEPTGTAVIQVADSGENSIVVTPAANNGLLPEDVAAFTRNLQQFDVVMLQLEIPIETVKAVLSAARNAGVLSILDAGPAQSVPDNILELAGVLSPNETEAEAMTGLPVASINQARQAATQLIERGARDVVVKMAAKGALYMNADEWLHVPAFKVDAVDTVAAGDAFTAALALKWGTVSALEAVRFANAAGALATLNHGAQAAMPTLEAVENFLN